ncbi:MAG: carboxypeptidase regulatory-like domain-containing protein, partial [Deltaproteobacteria bacterium]|nr:carboxypeptidase regulatory-like domain-containing protein [Deltaproteobacteria bacterium]
MPAGQYFIVVSKEGFQGRCAGLVTIIADGERKSAGTLELTSASALVRFAKGSGTELPGYEVGGELVYFANERALTAQFTAAGAVKMRAGWSEAELAAAAWEAFAVEKAVPLSVGEADGEKTLFIELQDQCGLVRRYTAPLTLDTGAPVGARVELDALEGLDGRKYVTIPTGQVTVRLSVDDELSGVDVFRLKIDAAPSDEQYDDMPGSRVYTTGLGTEQTAHTVFVQYRDRAGNESEVVSAEAVVDYEAPAPGAPPVVVTNGISDGTKNVVYDDSALLGFDVPAADAAQFALGLASGTGSWEDYVPQKALDLRGRARGDVSVFVRFRDNAKNETQEYSAAFFRETLGSVSGTVSLENAGEPQAPQVTVSVEGVSGVSTTADAQGAYTLSGVPGGARVLRATATGYSASTVPVSVVPGPQAVSAPPMTLAAARGIIRGQVTLDGGGAAAGAQVSVRGTGALGAAVASGTVAGSDGRYELAGLLAGTDYDLSASKDGYKLKTGARVDVKEGAVTDNVALVLELDPGSITGIVALEGGGSPAACSVAIAGGTPVNPDGTGAYTITDLPQGTYTVTFRNTGFDDAAQVAVVKAGGATTLPDVTLKKSRGTLTGAFTLAGAQSHAGISVKVAEAGLSVETASDGSFSVQNLVAQQYTVSASMYGYTPITGQTVTVPAGGVGTAAGGALAVALSASISGSATCDVGSCGSASVALNGTRFDGSTVSVAAAADGTGAFNLQNLAAGEYTVTVSKTGYKSGQAALSVAPGAAKSAGTIALSAERGSIAGTVTAGGTAREGAVLSLSGTSSIGIAVGETTTSGTGGAFRFGSILVGSYTLTATLSDFTSVSQGVAVASGAESNAGALNLAVNPGSVNGSVTLEGGSPGAGVTVSVEGGGASTVTIGNGTYTLTGVAPGTRALLFTKGSDYEQYRLAAVEVPAGASTTAPSVTLLRARGNITGTVVLVGGGDPTGVTVMVEGGQAVTSADPSGAFRLERVPVGSNYTVTGIEEGYMRATKTGLSVSSGADTDAGTLTLAKLVGDFKINDGSGVAGDRPVTLDLSTLNDPALVRASEDVTFSGGAQAYEAWQAAYPFDITSAGDGTKTVFMQYKDTGGQEHGPFSASVLLDTTPPVVSAVVINDGSTLTNSKIVHVKIDGTDGAEGSGIASMQMRNDDQFNDGDPWPDFEIDINTWTLADPTVDIELDKEVWVRLKDFAGRAGTAVKGTIRLDTLAPTGTLTLNGGDEWTTSSQITATVSGASADVDAMALSNVAGGTTVFTSYQASSTWFITPGDSAAAKPVYLRLKDAAGNYSLETNVGIKLDETPPPVPSLPVSSALTNDTTPSLTFGAVSDGVSSVT